MQCIYEGDLHQDKSTVRGYTGLACKSQTYCLDLYALPLQIVSMVPTGRQSPGAVPGYLPGILSACTHLVQCFSIYVGALPG